MTIEAIECRDRDEWLVERSNTIGASDVAAILGLNKWATPLAVWAQRTGRMAPKPETEGMRLGKKMEPIIEALYREETGRETENLGDFTIHRNTDMPLIHATLDRRILRERDSLGTHGVLELKNVGVRLADHWEDAVPLYVQCQIQAQLAATGLMWGSAAALIGGQQFVWKDVPRSQPFIEFMYVKIEAFAMCVRNNVEPDVGEHDLDTIKAIYPDVAEAKTLALPVDEGAALMEAIRKARAECMKYEKVKKEAETRIRQLMGDAQIGTLPDGSCFKRTISHVKETKLREYDRDVLTIKGTK